LEREVGHYRFHGTLLSAECPSKIVEFPFGDCYHAEITNGEF